jgi:hypothetical protein
VLSQPKFSLAPAAVVAPVPPCAIGKVPLTGIEVWLPLPSNVTAVVEPKATPKLRAVANLVAELALPVTLPVKAPLKVVALIVPVEGWTERVDVEYTLSVTVVGVNPSVPLLAEPQINERQLV